MWCYILEKRGEREWRRECLPFYRLQPRHLATFDKTKWGNHISSSFTLSMGGKVFLFYSLLLLLFINIYRFYLIFLQQKQYYIVVLNECFEKSSLVFAWNIRTKINDIHTSNFNSNFPNSFASWKQCFKINQSIFLKVSSFIGNFLDQLYLLFALLYVRPDYTLGSYRLQTRATQAFIKQWFQSVDCHFFLRWTSCHPRLWNPVCPTICPELWGEEDSYLSKAHKWM